MVVRPTFTQHCALLQASRKIFRYTLNNYSGRAPDTSTDSSTDKQEFETSFLQLTAYQKEEICYIQPRYQKKRQKEGIIMRVFRGQPLYRKCLNIREWKRLTNYLTQRASTKRAYYCLVFSIQKQRCRICRSATQQSPRLRQLFNNEASFQQVEGYEVYTRAYLLSLLSTWSYLSLFQVGSCCRSCYFNSCSENRIVEGRRRANFTRKDAKCSSFRKQCNLREQGMVPERALSSCTP